MMQRRGAAGRIMEGLLELLLFLPIWLTVNAVLTPESYQWIWMAALPVLQWVAMAAGTRLRVAWQQWMLAIAVGAGLGYIGMGIHLLFGIGLLAVSIFVMLLGMTLHSRVSNMKWYWTGLILYFAAAIVFPRVGMLESSVPALTAGGAVSLIVVLFMMNRRFLRSASLAGKGKASIPAALRSHNGLYMAVVTVLAVVITVLYGNAFGAALFAAIRWLLQKLLSAEPPETPPPQQEPPPSAAPMLPPAEEQGSELVKLIYDMIGYAFIGAVVIGILFGIGYWLYKYSGGIVKQWMNRIVAWLTRRHQSESEETAYTDEETGVFSWEAVGRGVKDSWLGRLLSRSRGERWEDAQTNAERVRYLYRRWLRSALEGGYELRAALTPKETEAEVRRWTSSQEAQGSGKKTKRDAGKNSAATDALLRLYYRVRYAGEDVGADEVERLKREIDRDG